MVANGDKRNMKWVSEAGSSGCICVKHIESCGFKTPGFVYVNTDT